MSGDNDEERESSFTYVKKRGFFGNLLMALGLELQTPAGRVNAVFTIGLMFVIFMFAIRTVFDKINELVTTVCNTVLVCITGTIQETAERSSAKSIMAYVCILFVQIVVCLIIVVVGEKLNKSNK